MSNTPLDSLEHSILMAAHERGVKCLLFRGNAKEKGILHRAYEGFIDAQNNIVYSYNDIYDGPMGNPSEFDVVEREPEFVENITELNFQTRDADKVEPQPQPVVRINFFQKCLNLWRKWFPSKEDREDQERRTYLRKVEFVYAIDQVYLAGLIKKDDFPSQYHQYRETIDAIFVKKLDDQFNQDMLSYAWIANLNKVG